MNDRTMIAAMCMAGLLNKEYVNRADIEAKAAIEYADALMKELEIPDTRDEVIEEVALLVELFEHWSTPYKHMHLMRAIRDLKGPQRHERSEEADNTDAIRKRIEDGLRQATDLVRNEALEEAAKLLEFKADGCHVWEAVSAIRALKKSEVK